jgi:hypothetical protein
VVGMDGWVSILGRADTCIMGRRNESALRPTLANRWTGTHYGLSIRRGEEAVLCYPCFGGGCITSSLLFAFSGVRGAGVSQRGVQGSGGLVLVLGTADHLP